MSVRISFEEAYNPNALNEMKIKTLSRVPTQGEYVRYEGVTRIVIEAIHTPEEYDSKGHLIDAHIVLDEQNAPTNKLFQQ
ncbi:hypothetical protein [Phytohalomonas tamaricis]|uniref:hypothetical protein n=1 Tax=Phytohalomonas tamaricis TaxID=2081032 RepID=UPI000D0B8D47|nr:hypothetical protein [Phytohalomonas tamaricis]